MRNLKNIMIMLLIGLFAVGFFSSCKAADTGYTDEEKAVLTQKAIDEGLGEALTSGGSGSSGSQARTVTGGSASYTLGDESDFVGSDFYSEIGTWTSGTQIFYKLIFDNLQITVKDNSGNNVTVVLNGSMNYLYNMVDANSMNIIIFGAFSTTVDGESLSNYTMDMKITVSIDGETYTYTIAGTAGGVTINESYSY